MSASSLQSYRVRDWVALRGDETFRLAYNLGPDSIVIDIGGYKGKFAQAIFDRYGSNVFVFEPCPQYFADMKLRFTDTPKVKVFPFGLGATNSIETFAFSEDATSAFKQGDMTFIAEVRSIEKVFSELGLGEIDLIKINVEGAEYGILETLAGAGMIPKVRDFQIQFHDFVPDAANRLTTARKILMSTHAPTYMFSFIWENWRRVDGDADADLRRTLFLSVDHMRETACHREQHIDELKAETAELRQESLDLRKKLEEVAAIIVANRNEPGNIRMPTSILRFVSTLLKRVKFHFSRN